jgi:hypothetical protein
LSNNDSLTYLNVTFDSFVVIAWKVYFPQIQNFQKKKKKGSLSEIVSLNEITRLHVHIGNMVGDDRRNRNADHHFTVGNFSHGLE